MITGNEPINPISVGAHVYSDGSSEPPYVKADGLTIRQHFAAMAMQSMISLQRRNDNGQVEQVWWIGTAGDREKIAEMSCKMSDALIAELNKTTKP